MKPATVIWPEFIAVHDWYHLLALISREKVASNWTYHSDDLQLFNNGRKEMDARSLAQVTVDTIDEPDPVC